MRKAASYTRRSSDQDLDKQFSIKVQREANRRWAKENDCTLVREYTDEGVSAYSGAPRPAFRAMLAAAHKGEFDVIVVYMNSRAFRNSEEAAIVRGRLRRAGVEIVTSGEPNVEGALGQLYTRIQDAINEYDSAVKATWVRSAKRTRVEAGLHNNRLPFGYCLGNCSTCTHPNGAGYCPRFGGPDVGDGRVGVAHPRDAHGVQFMFETYAAGDCSCRDLAERMNGTDWRAVGRSGLFSTNHLQRMLRNPFYIGMVSYRGELFPGLHEPLVSAELFERVQRVKRARRFTPHKAGRNVRVYPLSGMVRCGKCGGSMRGKTIQDVRWYVDQDHERGWTDCRQRSVRADDVEAQVVDLLRQVQPAARKQIGRASCRERV